jgi:copper resistance protein C
MHCLDRAIRKVIAIMRVLLVIASVLCIALGATAAVAHAHLDHASPPVDGTVPTAPSEVTLSYTQNLEPGFSAVEVTDGSGARVDQGKPQVSGSTLSVALKSIGPGTYHVYWHVLSVDTHKTEGNFTFTVGK